MTLLAGSSIVVGVDDFPCSKSALAQGAQLAHAAGATLHVFHVVDPLVVAKLADTLRESPEELRKRIADDSRKQLAETMGQLASVRPEKVEIETVVGSPIQEILRKVHVLSTDLLVLGVHGGFGTRCSVGSTAAKCIAKLEANLLVVREAHTGPFRTVVACVNFSQTSRGAIAWGVKIAALCRSRLHLLHVFHGPWHRLHYRAPTPEANPDFRKQYLSALQARLEALAEPFKATLKDAELHCDLLDHEDHRQGIIDFASKQSADLIILGSAKANLYSRLFGSTAERVIRDTPCSILVVKPAKGGGDPPE